MLYSLVMKLTQEKRNLVIFFSKDIYYFLCANIKQLTRETAIHRNKHRNTTLTNISSMLMLYLKSILNQNRKIFR